MVINLYKNVSDSAPLLHTFFPYLIIVFHLNVLQSLTVSLKSDELICSLVTIVRGRVLVNIWISIKDKFQILLAYISETFCGLTLLSCEACIQRDITCLSRPNSRTLHN